MIEQLFDISGKNVVITGGSGILCGAMARALGKCGCKVTVISRTQSKLDRVAEDIRKEGGEALAVSADVLSKESLLSARDRIHETFGPVDVLINGAGGNRPEATTSPELKFSDLPREALEYVFSLNLMGTILPSQVFAPDMVEKGEGVILNISSMSAFRPLTRVLGYSAAKAAVNSFTRWLAVHMAQEYSPRIRVNAIAPGFFLTEQNRYLLTNKETGELTERGKSIIDSTPMGRFGEPEELVGAVVWLISSASSFVTGTVIPVDGGFDAFSGV